MFQKYAAAEVLEARIQRAGLPMVFGHKHQFAYQPRPGFLYVRSRAISSRTNDNFDNFPAEEIKEAYGTFIGKPVFVNHHNDDHRRARGVIIDAALHEDRNPDGSADTWAEVLMEVDAVRFPKLAQAILAGEIDRTSMGVDVAFSICSVCNNKASTPLEYCKHIPAMKGMKVQRATASGEKENVLVYEKCYGLQFFENSLLVEEPADPTAFFLGIDDRGLAGSRSVTLIPQARGLGSRKPGGGNHYHRVAVRRQGYGEMKAPVEVDTLREEFCPVCGEADSFDGQTCKVCQYIKPPDEFMDPDLEKAQEVDLHQQADEMEDQAEQMDELAEGEVVEEDAEGVPGDEEEESSFGDEEKPPSEEGQPPDEGEEEDSGEDEDEEEDEDGEKGEDDKPPWMKKKKDKKKKESRQSRVVLGGDPKMGPALKTLISQHRRINNVERQNAVLREGLAFIAKVAGIEGHVAKILKRAEVFSEDENPAQPEGWGLPTDSPAPEAPAATTEETLGDVQNDAVGGGDATDDVEVIGDTSETDVAPAATTSVESTDTVLDEPLDLNEQTVDAPVAGTEDLGEGTRGEEGTNRTETEVRIGDPNNPQVAYPETGWTEAANREGRTFAALRLARLQRRARLSQDDEMVLAHAIASSDIPDSEIVHDIDLLERVLSKQPSSPRRTPQVRGNRAPRVAARTSPSLAEVPEVPLPKVAVGPSDDEFALD